MMPGSPIRVLLSMLLLVSVLAAQEPRGLPPFEFHTPNVQGGPGHSSVAVLHASDGLIYSLTREEVLSFDGARWKHHALPGARTWASLADRPGGGVFVGGDEEVGELIPGEDHVLRFRSLLEPFPVQRRPIDLVRQLLFQDDALYFTDGALAGRITLDAETGRVVSLDLRGDAASRGFKAGAHYMLGGSKSGRPYVMVRGTGICRWEQDGPELIPGADHFKNKTVMFFEEVGGELLVGGHGKAMDWLKDGKIQPFSIQDAEGVGYRILTQFCVLPGIGFAIGTYRKGLLICDEQGRLLWHLDRELGLRTDSILVMPAPDRQGGLWLPLDGGLLRIGLRSPLEIFDSRLGLEGEIRDACQHQGRWYVATSKAVYVYLKPERSGRPGRFQLVDDRVLQIQKMVSDGESLLLVGENGLRSLKVMDGKAVLTRIRRLSRGLFLLSRDSQRLWVGEHHGGVEEYAREQGEWKLSRRLLTKDCTPHAIVESDKGELYVLGHVHSKGGEPQEGFLRVLEISSGGKLTKLWSSEKHVDSTLSELHLYSWRGKILLRCANGLYELRDGEAFAVRPDFHGRGAARYTVIFPQPLALTTDRIWFRQDKQRYECFRKQEDGSYARWNPFRGIRGGEPTWFEVAADGRRAYMGNREGKIVSFRDPGPDPLRPVIRPMIQDLEFADGSQRFLGHSFSPPNLPPLPPAGSSFRIRYSLPAYDGTYHQVYQTRLKGLEEEWTEWRRPPFREFSSLPSGNYRFEVRALDKLGRLSEVQGMDIKILTPWYAKSWVILGFGCAGLFLLWGLVKLRTRVAEGRIRRLEEEIRQRELAEQEKHLLEERLRQGQRLESLGRMAGGVAHDFNNILTAILGHAELVREDVPPGKRMDSKTYASVEEIMKSGQRAADLTHRLLAFSRKQVLRPRVIEINEVLEGLKLMLSRILRDDIEMQMCLDPEAGKIRVDPGQLEQVILNLVLNACDAMPEGGKLEVWTSAVQERLEDAPFGSVTIGVLDNGTGIEGEILEDIFEPFFTTKPVGEGTGLGLSSALGIVEQSGGVMEVSSELGEGTLFEIIFPRLEEDYILAPAQQEKAPEGSGERLLLVDDDEAVRSIASMILSSKGYEIVEAESGEDALRLFETEERWDLLVTDMVMPGMNGRELARRLRAIASGLPVLYFSGYASDLDLAPDLSEGCTAYLQKPFHAKNLLAAVRELLDRIPTSS